MSKIDKQKTGRRDFIKTTATAAVGLGCLARGSKDALAQARLAGKPLLLPQTVNQFIAKNQAKSQAERLKIANQAKADVKAFIRGNFHLTPDAEQGLASLSNRQIEVIKTAIDRAAKGTNVQVKIIGNELPIENVTYYEEKTTKTTTTSPSGTDITIGGGCGEIDPVTGKVKDCKGTITITRKA